MNTGSTAGAGSGEFHVYRHNKRREETRLEFLEKQKQVDEKKELFDLRMQTAQREAEEKTSKNRKKRYDQTALRVSSEVLFTRAISFAHTLTYTRTRTPTPSLPSFLSLSLSLSLDLSTTHRQRAKMRKLQARMQEEEDKKKQQKKAAAAKKQSKTEASSKQSKDEQAQQQSASDSKAGGDDDDDGESSTKKAKAL